MDIKLDDSGDDDVDRCATTQIPQLRTSDWTAEEETRAHSDLLQLVQREGLRLDFTAGAFKAAYEMGSAIGKGKFATVFKAVRLHDGLVVAVKQLAIFDLMDEKSRRTCLKEIRLIQGLDHAHIVKFIDGFVEGRQLVLVFEFAEAGDLKRQLRKAREKGTAFEERVVWRYFSQLAEAVAHMHSKRIIHRDLKPANIFLTLAGIVKVGDLGLGRLLSDSTLVAHSKVGTPLYMAPETLRGGGHDYAADIWSLGCILYELCTLVNPFKEEGQNLYGLFQKICSGKYKPMQESMHSLESIKLVNDMLSVDPALRPDINQVLRISLEMRRLTRGGGGGGLTVLGLESKALPPAPLQQKVEPPFEAVEVGMDTMGVQVLAPSTSRKPEEDDIGAPTPLHQQHSLFLSEAEVGVLCKTLPLEASGAIMDRLWILGFFSSSHPPATKSHPPSASFCELHREGGKFRSLILGSPLPRYFFALPAISPSLQFSAILYALRWLAHSNTHPVLTGALEATASLQRQNAPPPVLSQNLASALTKFSSFLMAHFSLSDGMQSGLASMHSGHGLGVLVPLLILAEGALSAHRSMFCGGGKPVNFEEMEFFVEELEQRQETVEENVEEVDDAAPLLSLVLGQPRQLSKSTTVGGSIQSPHPPSLYYSITRAHPCFSDLNREVRAATFPCGLMKNGGTSWGGGYSSWREHLNLLKVSTHTVTYRQNPCLSPAAQVLSSDGLMGVYLSSLREDLSLLSGFEGCVLSPENLRGSIESSRDSSFSREEVKWRAFREVMDSSLSLLYALRERAKQGRSAVEELRKRVFELSEDLMGVEGSLEAFQEIGESRFPLKSSPTPLFEIKDALLKLRRENRELKVGLGLLNHMVEATRVRPRNGF